MRSKVALSIWAFVFTLSLLAKRLIQFEGRSRGPGDNYIRTINGSDVAICLVVFLLIQVVFLLVIRLEHKSEIIKKIVISKGHSGKDIIVFCGALLLMLIAWLPYILTLYPGVVNTDANNSISQIIWYGHPNSSHFPVFYTLYLGLFCKLGLAVSNINIGIMAYSVVQTIILATTLSYTLLFLYRRKLRVWLIVIFALFYAFLPLFPIYAMNVNKDVLFTCALMWIAILFADRRGSLALMLACLATMLFRNNGLYIVVGIAIFGTLASKEAKRILIPTIASICIYAALTISVTHIWDIRGDYKENMGIPLQQLAAVISDGSELPEPDEQLLYQILPQDTWKSEYAPCLADNIKWADGFNSDLFDSNKKGFLTAWVHGLVRYPGKYIEAYIMETFGYWVPFVQDSYGYADTITFDGGFGIENTDLYQRITGKAISVTPQKYFVESGTLFWIMMLCLTLIFVKDSKQSLVFLPALLNWVTIMIATPVAFSLRYVYVLLVGLPLFMGMACITRKNGEE